MRNFDTEIAEYSLRVLQKYTWEKQSHMEHMNANCKYLKDCHEEHRNRIIPMSQSLITYLSIYLSFYLPIKLASQLVRCYVSVRNRVCGSRARRQLEKFVISFFQVGLRDRTQGLGLVGLPFTHSAILLALEF